jgi:hypothetical protein
VVKRALVALAVAAGCSTFEDPDIVLDLRVIAMQAQPPEQVVDVDLANPPQPADILAQLGPSRVCAIVADPGHDRNLRWSMRLCKLDVGGRCDGDGVYLADGIMPDPDLTWTTDGNGTRLRRTACADVPADGNLLGVLLDALKGDGLQGLGGIDYGVVLRIGGEEASPMLDVFATKTLRVSPRIPADRTANRNPDVTTYDFDTLGMGLKLGHCDFDDLSPAGKNVVNPGQDIQLNPNESPGAREMYTVPTLDGNTRTFTEALTYQWLATYGRFDNGTTGGPHDAFGNPAQVYTDWHAPTRDEISGPTAVSIWIIQRDERLGVHWDETCMLVVP